MTKPRKFAIETRRSALPYGIWITQDGREVLFNRYYIPLMQRLGGVVSPSDPTERVPWIEQRWFYDDATPEPEKRRRAQTALNDFVGSR